MLDLLISGATVYPGDAPPFIGDVGADSDHEVRYTIDTRLRNFAARLASDPALLAKGEELKDELLAHPDVRDELWEAPRALRLA